MHAPGLQIDSGPPTERGPRVVVHGELDAHAAGAFATRVEDHVGPADEVVELDLSGLEFVDSTGLRALVDLERRLDSEGRRLVVRKPTEAVVRVLRIADLDHHFGVG